jgi:signal recognition particle subunit SRP54
MDALEVFHPDRMAGRILGMGDVVSLVEQAAAKIDEEDAKKLQEKLRKNKFDYNDFLLQLKQISKLGGLEGILRFLPVFYIRFWKAHGKSHSPAERNK